MPLSTWPKLGLTIIFSLLFSGFSSLFAQKTEGLQPLKARFQLQQKGRFYFSWGYNRSWYNKSDIHFTGSGHDFVLSDVVAADRQSKLSAEYFNPGLLTIPQFNCRIGYFLNRRYSLSIGWDHMKYVARDFQTVKLSGRIDPSGITDGGIKEKMEQFNLKYAASGNYDQVPVVMDPDEFLHLEHTDGLNYASLDLDRYDPLWQNAKHSAQGISLVSGVSAGMVVPRTDAHLFGSGKNHYWNVAGWGIGAKLGLQISIFKHFYLQSDFKYGYLDLLNIHTTDHPKVDKAQQHIVFYQWNGSFGFRF